jgi:DNA-binding NarL/FixJ family response regulator
MTIRVVLVDDQALVRVALAALIGAEADMAVAGEASDGSEGVALIRRTRPDVAVVDIRMPGMDGLELMRQVAADASLAATRVLVLTTFEVDEYVFEALRLGASGFLLKDAEPQAILQAVRLVAAGEALLAPSVTRRVVAAFAARPPVRGADPTLLAELTAREREVLALVGAGLSNEEIAERLVISPATARTHVSRAMGKLGARDRAQLVVFAYEAGLVGGA